MFTRFKKWRDGRREKLTAKTLAAKSDAAARAGADTMRNPTPTQQQMRNTGG